MPEVEIDDLASVGVIQDEPGYQIPPEGWTLGQNVRFIANGVEKLPGTSQTLGVTGLRGPSTGAPPAFSSGFQAGGTLAATTYFIKVTYTTELGESLPSPEFTDAVPVNNVAVVFGPGSGPPNASGYNVYVSTTTGTETKQNATPIALNVNWVEPTTGLIAGSALPSSDTSATPPPLFIMYISSAAQPWWLWASNTDAFAFDGTKDNKITRASGPYTAVDAKSWTGTLFQGVPILCDRTDNPQFWASYSAGQALQDLTNWPSGLKTRVMRSFLSYLFALNNTASGTNLPHQVRWSNAAVPGSLPSTWDFTDPTNDAGSTDLPDVASGQILDGQELQGQFFIYKEASAWRVQFIGSPFVFSFHSFMENTGILATRCLALTADGLRHAVATQDDIIIHNGISAESLLSKRMRRYIFNRIDQTNYDTSFMFTNPIYDEVWFCYPSTGQTEPDSALIWNYKYNSFTEATGIDFRATEIGTIPVTGLTWAQQTLTWAQDTGLWASSKRRRVVLANPNTRKLLLLDDTGASGRDGVPFTGTVQRTGLSIAGAKRNGQWVNDFEHFKLLTALWPKVQAQQPINVRVGYAQVVNGSTTWNPYQVFNPNTQVFVEGCEGSGRAVAIEFNSTNAFRLDGYKIDMTLTGKYG